MKRPVLNVALAMALCAADGDSGVGAECGVDRAHEAEVQDPGGRGYGHSRGDELTQDRSC